MGFLSVGRPDPINGQNLNVTKAGEVKKQETLNSVFGRAQAGAKQDPYKEFNDNANASVLGNKFMDEKELLKHGIKPQPGIKLVKDENGKLQAVPDPDSQSMDMNGGLYYTDKKGGTIRVQNHRIFGEGKSMSYKNENMAHFVTYDDNGKATGGIVQVKQSDGSIKVYDYDVDINGNKFIKSVKTSDLDYFADYE